MNKLFLSNTPFLKILVPFVLGLWVAQWVKLSVPVVVAVLLTGLLYGFMVYFNLRHPRYSRGYWIGLFSLLFLFFYGLGYGTMRKVRVADSRATVHMNLSIISQEGHTEKSCKYQVELLHVAEDTFEYLTACKGLLYISKAEAPLLEPGNNVRVRGRLLPFDPAVVPWQFDYSAYLASHRIVFRLMAFDYERTTRRPGRTDLRIVINRFKAYVNTRLNSAGMGKEGLALLNALFMGDRYLLSYEQKNDFAEVGAIHLLAVSGLHVGVIYLLIVLLLRPVIKQRLVLFILIGMVLWGYALFTGWSPSVVRATLMFTVIEAGNLSQRRISVLNLLSVSMFLILLADPMHLYHVGFWLSHAAVASIAMFYPAFNRMAYFRFPPFRWMWSVMMLSLAAQLGALPISLFVFHQCPTVFLLTNWLLLPVVAPVLLLTIVAVVFSPFQVVLEFVVPAIDDMLRYMDAVVKGLGSWEYSAIHSIPFHWWDLGLGYAFIIAWLLYAEAKTLRCLKWTLLTGITFFLGLHLSKYSCLKEGIIVVETHKGLVVNYFQGDENQVYSSGPVKKREAEYLFTGLWSANGIRPEYQWYGGCLSRDSVITAKVICGHPFFLIRDMVCWPQGSDRPGYGTAIVLERDDLLNDSKLFAEIIVQDEGKVSGAVLKKFMVSSTLKFSGD